MVLGPLAAGGGAEFIDGVVVALRMVPGVAGAVPAGVERSPVVARNAELRRLENPGDAPTRSSAAGALPLGLGGGVGGIFLRAGEEAVDLG